MNNLTEREFKEMAEYAIYGINAEIDNIEQNIYRDKQRIKMIDQGKLSYMKEIYSDFKTNLEQSERILEDILILRNKYCTYID